MVKSQGITGTSMLALEKLNPTNYPPLAIDFTPKHIYIPSAPAQLTRMLESIEKSLNNIQQTRPRQHRPGRQQHAGLGHPAGGPCEPD